MNCYRVVVTRDDGTSMQYDFASMTYAEHFVDCIKKLGPTFKAEIEILDKEEYEYEYREAA